ncbi:hypothetical protein HZ992_12360 [Rhizobacter sp. AJA081-3]|uniref:hypothetical protein n=1 Tax=Rhizobacter sp. AJA081-3 TaxID=2753607 RepID=UPI001ADEDFFE|nr:hypothetical protein [Rhizobacter sp. AJA081-3]QTN25691.1 hypothetical protein HZ992_12360 [Rhizobacter sp. AJA081-3]
MGVLYPEGALETMVTAGIGRAEPSAQYFAAGGILGACAVLRWRIDAASQIGVAGHWWSDAAGRRHTWRLWWQGGAW